MISKIFMTFRFRDMIVLKFLEKFCNFSKTPPKKCNHVSTMSQGCHKVVTISISVIIYLLYKKNDTPCTLNYNFSINGRFRQL